ncbi:hypothetical protein [Usitatibacter palustris]|uniref:Uncharacterized protein n=1 Tax=Usitatibacter palustris TaxID=2732487 RepID=A0A6M4H1S3_9PROT|nr:hypothetical protein [Usitatibacter palustris]QJR13456.1 hypothetical protein DSM104440_00240 [Usitatibacter palustris]
MKAFLLLLLGGALVAAAPRAKSDDVFAGSHTRVLKVQVKSALESSSRVDRDVRAPSAPDVGVPVFAYTAPVEDPRMKESRSSCSKAGKSLCYDPASGKIVYKKTREFMPAIPGMRAENISVRRDRITFKYSFQ